MTAHISPTDAILQNPWRNAYWFARMMISGDKYGAIGKDSKFLAELCAALQNVLDNTGIDPEPKLDLAIRTIRNLFEKRFTRKTAKTERINLFLNDLIVELTSVEDVAVFILTARSLMIQINTALDRIPSNDLDYTQSLAKAYLDQMGQNGLANVINLWDDAGVKGCLNAERAEVVHGFAHLRSDLVHMPDHQTNLILTAYVQEFERRLGQKRKARAGGSLENVTSFLFDYFAINAEHAPDRFQADIEVDKWVRCKDKWLIGISCKRTLRERWKQVSSANGDTLSKFKIKEIWHLVTYDEDLSDDKLTLLGGQRHIFYLRDDSRRLTHAQSHVGMQAYVRPMSQFIEDLRKEQT